jgi:hypothetical protein
MMRCLLPAALGLVAGCGGPGPGPLIETVATGDVSNPTLARAGDGTFYVAWVSTDRTGSNLWLASREPDGLSRPPIRVNDRVDDAAPHLQAPPQVAAGPGAAVYVLWSNSTPVPGRRFPASDLRLARSDDGGRTFSPAISVNDDAGGPPAGHTFHNMAVADDGTIYVSWIDSRRRGPSGTHHPNGPHTGTDGGSDIRVARSMDGGRTFGAGAIVDSAACPCCRTSLAVNGWDVWVAWRKVFDGDVRDVVVAHSADGGVTFDPPVPVHRDGWVYPGCPHAGPALLRDGAGVLHVTWYTGAEGRRGLHHAISLDGGRTFEPPRPIQGNRPVPASLAALAWSGAAVWRVWEDKTGPEPAILLAEVGGRPARVGAGTAPAMVAGPEGPTVAWLGQGAVLLAWCSRMDTANTMPVARCAMASQKSQRSWVTAWIR